jgi:hypothetical protein
VYHGGVIFVHVRIKCKNLPVKVQKAVILDSLNDNNHMQMYGAVVIYLAPFVFLKIVLLFVSLYWFVLSVFQSLVIPDKFQHILRVMGTNIDGKRKVMFAMTAIKGVGRRYANIVLKKADIDLDKRAGECTDEEVSCFTQQAAGQVSGIVAQVIADIHFSAHQVRFWDV